METHGLPERQDGPDEAPTPDEASGAPALRVGVGTRVVLEASDALRALLGREASEVEGRLLDDLWLPSERDAIRARFDDVVLLGADRFGALAVPVAEVDEGGRIWVDVVARFEYAGRERLDVWLTPVPRAPADPLAPTAEARARAEPPAASLPAYGHAPGSPARDLVAADEAEHLSMAALEATGAAVLLVEEDGRVGIATRPVERLLGRSPGELRHRPVLDVLRMSDTALEAWTAAREGGLRQTVLVDVPGRDGSLMVEWVPGLGPGSGYAVLAPPEAAPSGETERIKLQAQLVSHVSHDLRGALASTYSGLRTLVADLEPGSAQHETAVQSLEELQRASRIVDEVLALSRPGRLRRVDLDLGVLLADVTERYRSAAEGRGIRVEIDAAPGITVSVDRTGLERSLGNLLENAIRAMPEGGALTVRCVPEDRVGPGAAVTVADTGLGIPRHLQATVFDPFVSHTEGGSGLGLTIARHIVVAHGGQIGFDSEPGSGTTFTVWLPTLA